MVFTVVEGVEGSISDRLVTKPDATMKAGASVAYLAPPGLDAWARQDWFVCPDNLFVNWQYNKTNVLKNPLGK